jgi:hypothetical protein
MSIGRCSPPRPAGRTRRPGAADFVERKNNVFAEAAGWYRGGCGKPERALRLSRMPSTNCEEDFGEVLRHELNNPLTEILGNAAALLPEIRRNFFSVATGVNSSFLHF